MADNGRTNSNQVVLTSPKDKVWYDPEEFAIRKRLPPTLPRRPIDVYISNKTAFKAQLDRCKAFIDKGEPEFYLHSLGAAIPRALNLALQIQKDNSNTVSFETVTSTVELTDDFEPLESSGSAPNQNQRHNSAVHIKICYCAQGVESAKTVTALQEQ